MAFRLEQDTHKEELRIGRDKFRQLQEEVEEAQTPHQQGNCLEQDIHKEELRVALERPEVGAQNPLQRDSHKEELRVDLAEDTQAVRH